MKWSVKIARVLGIDVYLHMTFLILIAWIALGYWQLEGTLAAVVEGVGFILALFFCVVLHEFGHALTARRFGIRTRHIVLLPIGGIASIERIPEEPAQEILIALAGPAVSFTIAAALWLPLRVSGSWVPLEVFSFIEGSFWQKLMLINLLLGGFNLLPALPMDGGRVFRALLATRLDHLRATRIASTVAQVLALFLALVGLYHNLFLVIIAVFIWIGAATEASFAGVKAVLSGTSMRNAMVTDFEVLDSQDSLGKAVKLTLAGTQKDFPVMGREGVVGVLRQSDLVKGLHDHGTLCRVDQVMSGGIKVVTINEPMEHVLEDMQTAGAGLLVVMENEGLAGIIDLDNIMELLKFERALAEHEATQW